MTEPMTTLETAKVSNKGIVTLLFAILAVLSIQLSYTVYRNINISHCVASRTTESGEIGVGTSTYCLAH